MGTCNKQGNSLQKKTAFLTNSIREFFLITLQREFDVLRDCVISVTNVVLLDKGKMMKIYISCFSIDSSKKEDSIMAFLNANKKQIRFMFGKQLADKVKFIPSIQFYIDDTQQETDKINSLFENINK